MLICGRCHCGNIAFTLDWQPQPSEIPVRACTCTFCTKHGAAWTANADGVLTVTVSDDARVAHYAFETRTAQFHVCRECGVVPLATSDIAGRRYAVVNVNTFENVDAALLRRSSASFDGEDESARLARRTKNWIGSVRFLPFSAAGSVPGSS